MKIEIQIKEQLTQLQQMADQLGMQPIQNEIQIPSTLGEGFCRYIKLPFEIQLHHYRYCLQQQVEVQSINNLDNGMYIVNINLSKKLLNKHIGKAERWLSREGNSGVLFYSPGNNSVGKNEINLPFEVLFFSIPKATIDRFLESTQLGDLKQQLPFCHYAEIDDQITGELLKALDSETSLNLFAQQGKILEILGRILSVFYQNEWHGNSTGLKMADVERLLKIKGILNAHIFGKAPTIEELAQQCNMSASQLKSKFKSLFGNSIYQYYLKSKLAVAKRLVSEGESTIAEIGYQLGYSNIAQFSAQFKKEFGSSPSRFKS